MYIGLAKLFIIKIFENYSILTKLLLIVNAVRKFFCDELLEEKSNKILDGGF